jgi:hybrid polyketide synthase/nonribosomal peptide synthetase ACE1
MGLDSLVAVDIRTWFLQELGVDLPVLKILGGASVADLIDETVQKLPQEILSRFTSITETSGSQTADQSAQPIDAALPLSIQNLSNAPSSERPSAQSSKPSTTDSVASVASVPSSPSSDIDVNLTESVDTKDAKFEIKELEVDGEGDVAVPNIRDLR